jgi:DNA-binding NarL/FixJ family response regulator
MPNHKIRVLLADDQSVVREGLALIINAEHDMETIGEAADGRDAIEQTRLLHPQVVVMDIRMPIMNGIEATRVIRSNFPEIQIIGLSMGNDAEEGKEIRKAGAHNYLNKSESDHAIISAIRKAATYSQAGVAI